MQRSHARLAPSVGDDEDEADGEEEQQLLRVPRRADDDREDGHKNEGEDGGEDDHDSEGEDDGEDDDESKSGESPDEEHSIGMDTRDEDAIECSSFWDADDAFVPLPPLPQGTQKDHSIIDVLAEELLQREIPEYMEAFEIVIPDAEIVVGSVPVEDIQQRELDVELAKLRHAELESELYRQRETQLSKQEVLARTRLLSEARKRHEAIARERLQFVEAMQLRTRRLGYVFQQAENHLKTELERQQARVQRIYGDLAHSRVPQSRKRYRVEWQKIPVTIKIRVKMLSALKDKLPSGHYVLVATLYDRLGGHALHWSAWDPEYAGSHARWKADTRRYSKKTHKKSDESDVESTGGGLSSVTGGSQIRLGKPNFTRPFHHRGRFYNTEVTVNQNMYLVCPPECALRPGNVLIFELFHLSLAHNGSSRRRRHQQQQSDDQVVAWGAMPLSTPDFACVQGKFKIPLLRGEMDSTIDKFRDIEQLYQDDLSSWLCNLYFKVSHLEKCKPAPPPLSVRGSRHKARDQTAGADDDFDVEIDESSGLYRVENNHQRYMRKLTKKHIHMGKSGRDLLLREDDDQATSDLNASHSSHSQIRARRLVAGKSDARLEGVDEGLKLAAKGNEGGATTVSSYPSSRTLLLEDPSEGGDEQERQQHVRRKASDRQTSSSSSSFSSNTPPLSSLRRTWKRFTAPKKTRVYSDEMVEKKRHELQTQAQAHTSGSDAFTVRQSSHMDFHQDDDDDDHDDDDDSGDSSNADEDESENHPDGKPGSLDVDNYKFSVNAATSVETAHHKRFHMQRKLYYLRHELLVDLGASNFKTLEFWRLVALLLFTLWVRVYVHYVMQWVFLRGNHIPVYDFRPQWTTCLVKYTWRTIATSTEIGVIVFGVLGNVLLFGFFALCAAVGQRFVGELPHFASSFIVCVGLATVLDPYLVLVADVASHHYNCSSFSAECLESLASAKCKCVESDAFKLYVRFLAQEGSGLVGIIMTLIIYAALTCVSLVCLYAYLLHVHMNGRMLDVYRRVHGQEDDFFVPHDSEIGLPDLHAICEQARRWKGPRGAQRKVFVHEYTLTDPLDPGFEEKSVHVAVYTMELDGARELHRHFLKSHDGAVIELFGEIGAGTGGAWLHGAHNATSLALLYNIIQDQQNHAQVSEASAEHLTQLLDAL